MQSTAPIGEQGPWQMNCCSLQPWLLEAVSTLSQTFPSLPNCFCNITLTIIFWLQSILAPQKVQGRQKPSKASQGVLPPADTCRAILSDLCFTDSGTANRTAVSYPSIVTHYVFFTKGWNRGVPSPWSLSCLRELTFLTSNRRIYFLSRGREQSFPSSSASRVSKNVYFLHNMVYSSAEDHWTFVLWQFNWCDPPSQPGFKERGSALLSSSPAVDALTGLFFFPLARSQWGITRAENGDRGFPMQTMAA